MDKTLVQIETQTKNSRGLLAGHLSSLDLIRCYQRLTVPTTVTDGRFALQVFACPAALDCKQFRACFAQVLGGPVRVPFPFPAP